MFFFHTSVNRKKILPKKMHECAKIILSIFLDRFYSCEEFFFLCIHKSITFVLLTFIVIIRANIKYSIQGKFELEFYFANNADGMQS